jgi:peptidoglycan/LPS O-acetylase OafA/YrhL
MSRKILGLELLRGVCALLVACYHCLSWSGIAELSSWSLYAVYVFFVISGAVLYQNYHDAISLAPTEPHQISVPQFLLKRFARLAPLMWACVLIPATLHNTWLPNRYFLNLSFLFGFGTPGLTSSVTGAWSIGIEFVLYALFPILITFARDMRTIIATLIVFLALRLTFVSFVLKGATLASAWAVYTQPAAFLIFFFGGISIAKIMPRVRVPHWILFLSGIALALVLFLYPGADKELILQGTRGFALTLASIAIVAAFFWSPSFKPAALVSQFFGDISYGLYLLHPLVWAALPKYAGPLPAATRIALTLAISAAAAWLSLRFYERPARAWILRWAGIRASRRLPAAPAEAT